MVKIDCLNMSLNISPDYITNKLNEWWNESEKEISSSYTLSVWQKCVERDTHPDSELQGDMMNDKK